MFSAGFWCSRLIYNVLGGFWVFLAGCQCSWLGSHPDVGVLDRFCVLSAGFGFSLLVLGVLIQIWVFSPGFGCSCLVFSVLGRFWVFSAGFGCSRLVFSVLGRFWVFSPGFQCPWMVLGVISWFWVFLVGFLPFIRFGCSQRVFFFLRG